MSEGTVNEASSLDFTDCEIHISSSGRNGSSYRDSVLEIELV